MDITTAARVLMTDSLGFHIIFVSLSIGLPLLINIYEFWAWKTRREDAKQLVRLLARWTAIMAIVGVMSGTLIALQFSTVWSVFIAQSRPYVGSLFALEGYMFLIEAVFLSWYLLTMRNVGTLKHWLIGIPITLGAVGSAVFITTVNAWMNNPTGLVTSTTVNEILHSVVAYFFATALCVLGFVAWRARRSSKLSPSQLFLMKSLTALSLGFMVLLGILGHQSAVDIARTQPAKLAAIEILDTTQTHAPLRIGGEIDPATGKATGGLVIPAGLSMLVRLDPATEVKGLNETPHDKWPLLIVHILFDIKMVLIGGVTAGLVALCLWLRRRKQLPGIAARIIAIASFSGLILIELGWMITELGRQPWAIHGKLLTANAVTPGLNLYATAYIFPILFVLLFFATVFALRVSTSQWSKKEKTSW